MMAAMAPLYWRLHMEQLDGLLAGVDVALTDDVLDRMAIGSSVQGHVADLLAAGEPRARPVPNRPRRGRWPDRDRT